MANAGERPKFLRWGHGEPPSEYLVAFSAFGAGNEPTAARTQHHAVAGRLEFWQGWTATLGSHNMGYVMRANSSVLILRLVWQT